MTRIAVVADAHCDDYGSRIDAASGLNARWIDTVGMLRWVANDAAIAQDCDALIVAGDLTESRHPAPWRVAQIGEALEAFDDPVILVRGNHDGLRGGRSIVDVLAGGREHWRGFSTPGVTLVDDVAIACLPFLDRHHLRALPGFENVTDAAVSQVLGEAYLTIARGLYVQAKALAPAAVLVVHQSLAGGLMSDSQAAFLGDQGLIIDTRALGAIGFEAVLAGHFHKHQVVSSDPLVVYAGSPYRTDFGEELQPKGYLVVDVEPGRASFEFIETPARRFVTVREGNGVLNFDGPVIEGAVVRVLDLDPSVDLGVVRSRLEELGVWEIHEIRQRRIAAPVAAGGMAEGLTAPEALSQYFDGDPDREVLVERGRGILAEVVG